MSADPARPDPDNDLDVLLERNRAWAEARRRADPDVFAKLARVHRPPFLFVGCCDARKPLDVVTGAAPGALFLHRNVANQVREDDPAIGASFEFALGVLECRHLIICGHTGCGGVQAALGPDPGGQLARWIEPVRRLAGEVAAELEGLPDAAARADRLAERNVLRQLENALGFDIVQTRLRDPARPLRIHGWMFCIERGLLEPMALPLGAWREQGLLPDAG